MTNLTVPLKDHIRNHPETPVSSNFIQRKNSPRWNTFHTQNVTEDDKMDYFELLPRTLQPSPLKENLGNMDRLTQLQDAVEKVN